MRTHRLNADLPAVLRSRPQAVLRAFETMFDHPGVRRRFLDVDSGRRVHVVEAGDGVPVVLLHGTSTSSLSFVPLVPHLAGVRMIIVDRPGRGLSDPDPALRSRPRQAAVAFVDAVLDALGLEDAVMVGQSGGGIWSLWYALERPERVRSMVLLGSVPLLPGTVCPLPLRLLATPGVGKLMTRAVKPTRKTFLRMMSAVGEAGTAERYPHLVDAQVATASDPTAAAADLAEYRSLGSPFGFRPSMMFRADELRQLALPTLMIWGDHDPIGSVEAAQAAAALLPNARLEVLPAGHIPQFGHPERVAALVSEFTTTSAG